MLGDFQYEKKFKEMEETSSDEMEVAEETNETTQEKEESQSQLELTSPSYFS